jgi:mRNA interferase RelE/StbE
LQKKAQKELDKVDVRYRARIIASLLELQINPFTGKKLSGELNGLWSLRIWPYRIIYIVKKNELIILVIKIGHRQGVYE